MKSLALQLEERVSAPPLSVPLDIADLDRSHETALGTGLTLLSRDFEVRATSRGDFRAHGSDALQRWTAMPCAAPEGFAAAVAMFDETGNTENVLDS